MFWSDRPLFTYIWCANYDDFWYFGVVSSSIENTGKL